MSVHQEPGDGGEQTEAVTPPGQAPDTNGFSLYFNFHLLANQDASETRKSKKRPGRKTETRTRLRETGP